MDQKFDIDELFRETLGNATDVPPSSAWNHISNQISHGASPSTGNSAGNWFSKLGTVSKVAVVTSGMAIAVLGTMFMLNQESEQVNVPPKNNVEIKQKQVQIDTPVIANNQAQKMGTLGEFKLPKLIVQDEYLMPISNDFQSVGVDSVSLNIGQSRIEYQSKVEKWLNSQTENHQNSIEKGSKIELNIACKNTMSLMQLPSAGFLEKGEKFEVRTGNDVEKVLVSFGDGRNEQIRLEGNEAVASHLYKVRERKLFLVKAIGQYKGGCKDSSMIEIEVLPTLVKEEELIPTVFTPNGDGKNDEYFVSVADPLSYSMLILDMKKNRVFYSENRSESWKGNCGVNPCESGFYEVILKLQYTGEKELVINKRINLVRSGN
jgi:hypothetical protein